LDYYQVVATIRLAEFRHLGDTSGLPRLVALLGRLLDPLLENGYFLQAAKCLLLRALAYDLGEETDKALSSLNQALELARPGSLVSIFIEAGPQLLPLLAKVSGRYQPYAASIGQAFASQLSQAGAQPPASTLADPLTGREQEVLQQIAAGLSNREIQEKLVISKNTVRTHIKNLYSKLGVHSRTQAIKRARELNLL
jgi:LuxR family maltose regulon positive regulatory protein